MSVHFRLLGLNGFAPSALSAASYTNMTQKSHRKKEGEYAVAAIPCAHSNRRTASASARCLQQRFPMLLHAFRSFVREQDLSR